MHLRSVIEMELFYYYSNLADTVTLFIALSGHIDVLQSKYGAADVTRSSRHCDI